MQPQRMSDYIHQQTLIQSTALRVAMETQEATDARHLQSGIKGVKDEFKIGDYVLVQYESNDHRAPTKLHPRWRGPCRVINVTVRPEGDIYTVQHLDSTKYEDFHVKLLRAFNYDPNHVDPIDIVDISTTDSQTFLVERILQHRFTSTKQTRSNMEVQVKWVGYSQSTWEPYANVATNIVFHNYLKDHNLAHLLREGYKTVPLSKRQRVNK
jgi:Chromo (CHRromatin Organisation MOdifier) domain